MKNSKIIIKTGEMNLSGKVVVSDPCYDRDVWCMSTDIVVKPGRYKTFIIKKDQGEWGVRVAAIIAVHSEHVDSLKVVWEPLRCSIGVDSGQCGIFDDAAYPTTKEEIGEYDDETSFYGECCKITLGDDQGGTLKSGDGVVSSSGYGDGGYELLCQNYDGECIALMLDFDLEKHIKIMKALAENWGTCA